MKERAMNFYLPFLCLVLLQAATCFQGLPVNMNDFFSKLDTHFHNVFGGSDQIEAVKPNEASIQQPSPVSSKPLENMPALESSQKVPRSQPRTSDKAVAKASKRKLGLEEELDSLAKLLDINVLGNAPTKSKGGEKRVSQTRIIHRKSSDTVKKFSRSSQVNRYVKTSASAIDRFSNNVVNLNENEVTTYKSPLYSSPSQKKYKSKIYVKKILHNDLADRNKDYSEVIINSYSNADWDDYDLDIKNSIYHSKLNSEVLKILKNPSIDDNDLNNISVTQEDVIKYLQQLHGRPQVQTPANVTGSSNNAAAQIEDKRMYINDLIDLLSAHSELLAQFNPNNQNKGACDQTLVLRLDALLQKIASSKPPAPVVAPIAPLKQIHITAHKTEVLPHKVTHSIAHIQKQEVPNMVLVPPPAFGPSNSLPLPPPPPPPPLFPPLSMNVPPYPGPNTLPPEYNIPMPGLPLFAPLQYSPAPHNNFIYPQLPLLTSAQANLNGYSMGNQKDSDVDYFYHYFPAHYIKKIATKNYLKELNGLIKKIPIVDQPLASQQDAVHHDHTDSPQSTFTIEGSKEAVSPTQNAADPLSQANIKVEAEAHDENEASLFSNPYKADQKAMEEGRVTSPEVFINQSLEYQHKADKKDLLDQNKIIFN